MAGFLTNLEALQKEADEESAQWEQFLRALVIRFPEMAFTAEELAHAALHDCGFAVWSPDERAEGGFASLVRRIGKGSGAQLQQPEAQANVAAAIGNVGEPLNANLPDWNSASLLHRGSTP